MLEYNSLSIETGSRVYMPAEDSMLAARLVSGYLASEKRCGLEAIDMGTGTGILGLAMAMDKHVRRVRLSDINPDAVDLARRNYERNKDKLHASCLFSVADMFPRANEKYDVITFNAPYLNKEEGEKGELWWDGGKEGIEVSLRFLEGAKTHIKSGGSVFLVYSSLGNEGQLLEEINKLGFVILETRSEHYFFEDIRVSRMVREPISRRALSEESV